MERIIGIERQGGWVRDEYLKAERLRHRRAAAERPCVRSGLLHLCTPVPPEQAGCDCLA